MARNLEPIAASVPELADAATTLDRLADETREVAYTLRDLGEDWDDDPARLERSRPGWPSTGGWPPGSTARPTSSPRGWPRSRPSSPRSSATRPT